MLVNSNAIHIPLADKSVQCCVTSPPYWGLRDYGVGGQLGLEQTPEEYVENMVKVFREVWRVLRDDGTLWLNLGDSYWGGKGRSAHGTPDRHIQRYADGKTLQRPYQEIGKFGEIKPGDGKHEALKPKDLVGIPWRVAFALQADGWYLRNDIIWNKPNPMPESVRDRCTKSHEYIFLLSKNKKYYYDNEAIKEPAKQESLERMKRGVSDHHKNVNGAPGQTPHSMNKPRQKVPAGWDTKKGAHGAFHRDGRSPDTEYTATRSLMRNKRTVWTITTKPYKGAHCATFPPELPEVCIKAGTSEAGKCPDCGDPFERIIEKSDSSHDGETVTKYANGSNAKRVQQIRDAARKRGEEYSSKTKTVGWQPQCDCGKDPIPCMVLDPFAGSGTTCMVARDLGRDSVGLDLSFDYLVNNAKTRLEIDKLEYWKTGAKEVENNFEGLPMFHEANLEKE